MPPHAGPLPAFLGSHAAAGSGGIFSWRMQVKMGAQLRGCHLSPAARRLAASPSLRSPLRQGPSLVRAEMEKRLPPAVPTPQLLIAAHVRWAQLPGGGEAGRSRVPRQASSRRGSWQWGEGVGDSVTPAPEPLGHQTCPPFAAAGRWAHTEARGSPSWHAAGRPNPPSTRFIKQRHQTAGSGSFF